MPGCTCSIPHNAPFRTEMCTFLFWMEHCGIRNTCILGFVKLVYCRCSILAQVIVLVPLDKIVLPEFSNVPSVVTVLWKLSHIPYPTHDDVIKMETFSALLAIYAGNSLVPGEFPAQRPVTRSFDVFFDLRLNKRISKQSWGWWFETLSRPSWRHRNEVICQKQSHQGWAIFEKILIVSRNPSTVKIVCCFPCVVGISCLNL